MDLRFTHIYHVKQHPFFSLLFQRHQHRSAMLSLMLLARQDPEGCQENEEHRVMPFLKGQSEICVTNATCHITKLMNYHSLN